MILSWLTSAGNNIVDKTKNPFLGTFTLVWLARNWELVFALFNFDKNYKLDDKIQFLSERIQYETFWTEVGWNVFWTFIVLILTYLLINIARAISNLFEKRLTPIIYKLTDYKSLVPKSEYQGVLTRMNDLQERLDKEIQEKLRLQNERDELEERVNKQGLELVEIQNHEMNKNINELNKDIIHSRYLESISTLIDEFSISDIHYTLDLIKDGNPIWKGVKYEIIGERLLELGFFNNKTITEEGTSYEITKEGEDLYNELVGEIKNRSETLNDSKDNLMEKTLDEIEHKTLQKVIDDALVGVPVEYGSYNFDIAKVLLRRGFLTINNRNNDNIWFSLTREGNKLAKKL